MQNHTHLLDNSTLHFYHFQLICLIFFTIFRMGWGGVSWCGGGVEAFIYCSVRDRDLFEYCLIL